MNYVIGAVIGACIFLSGFCCGHAVRGEKLAAAVLEGMEREHKIVMRCFEEMREQSREAMHEALEDMGVKE